MSNRRTRGVVASPLKTVILTGTTGATEGSTISVAHNLGLTDMAQVVGLTTIVLSDSNQAIPSSFSVNAGFQFDAWLDINNFNLKLDNTASEAILSNAYKALVTFIE